MLVKSDHVLPIFGKTISGFHHEDNLEIVPAEENMIKGHKVTKEMLEAEEKRLLEFCKNNNL